MSRFAAVLDFKIMKASLNGKEEVYLGKCSKLICVIYSAINFRKNASENYGDRRSTYRGDRNVVSCSACGTFSCCQEAHSNAWPDVGYFKN